MPNGLGTGPVGTIGVSPGLGEPIVVKGEVVEVLTPMVPGGGVSLEKAEQEIVGAELLRLKALAEEERRRGLGLAVLGGVVGFLAGWLLTR